MKRFAELIEQLDRTTRTNEKVSALTRYFQEAEPEDAVWTLHILSGQRQRRVVSGSLMRGLAAERAGIPLWLVEESYAVVGDLAETLALLVRSDGPGVDAPLHRIVREDVLGLRGAPESEVRSRVLSRWDELSFWEAFVWHKLLTGAFRIGVGKGLVLRGLEAATGVPRTVLAHRMAGDWKPTPETWRRITGPETDEDDRARPYPFFLAHPLESEPKVLGDIREWQIEWKWDGIRGQLMRRGDSVALWSRGEELITAAFPEIVEAAAVLPDGSVLDGEVLAISPEGVSFVNGIPAVRPFADLQRRLNRKKVGPKLRAEVPVFFLSYDILERGGEDLRKEPTAARREALERLISDAEPLARSTIGIAPLLTPDDWSAAGLLRDQARDIGVEGLMLKSADAEYGVGRTRGAWWKWKVEPLTLDAVMLYAQAGSGRRANLHTDYTFGVWRGDTLVPIAKAYSGLTDKEIREVDRWVRDHTNERYGPVRSVEPGLVFELAFDSIRRSSRHKSGLALRFPRIARLRRDKPIEEADSIETAEALLRVEESGNSSGEPRDPAPSLFDQDPT